MRPYDLSELRTYGLHSRPSKVSVADLGSPAAPSTCLSGFLDTLPKQLAANELRRVCDHVVRTNREGRSFAIAIGGHVIKTGCAPYLIDLIQGGVITSVAMNGSAAIHDFELAFCGHTSEDVSAQLHAGNFGMARETADAFAVAAREGARGEKGLGAALGEYMAGVGVAHP
ncbi:MAG TPA: hypothetical protein VLM40_15345, partial [Gemmata sp.]|nr:hypothetical protein [Gemmata sp.]